MRSVSFLIPSVFLAFSATADTYSVTTTRDVVDKGATHQELVEGGDGFLSLREAINLANRNPGPDRIRLLAKGAYNVSIPPDWADDDYNAVGDLDIRGDLTIEASLSDPTFPPQPAGLQKWRRVKTTRALASRANSPLRNRCRILDVRRGNVWLIGVYLAYGDTRDVSPGDGGQGAAVRVNEQGKLNAVSCIFYRNRSRNSGGAILGVGPLYFLRCYFELNQSFRTRRHPHESNGGDISGGGAILALSTLRVVNSQFRDNRSRRSGGAIVSAGETLSLQNVTLEHNKSAIHGGGVYAYDVRSTTVGQVQFTQNTVRKLATNSDFTLTGGGLSVRYQGADQPRFTLLNTTFANNRVASDTVNQRRGGGLAVWGARRGELVVTHSDFQSNKATGPEQELANTNRPHLGKGGGAYIDAAMSLELANTLFHSNSTSADGGGLYLSGSGRDKNLTRIDKNVFEHNSAHQGGGVFFYGVYGTLSHSSFLGNYTNNSSTAGCAKASSIDWLKTALDHSSGVQEIEDNRNPGI